MKGVTHAYTWMSADHLTDIKPKQSKNTKWGSRKDEWVLRQQLRGQDWMKLKYYTKFMTFQFPQKEKVYDEQTILGAVFFHK